MKTPYKVWVDQIVQNRPDCRYPDENLDSKIRYWLLTYRKESIVTGQEPKGPFSIHPYHVGAKKTNKDLTDYYIEDYVRKWRSLIFAELVLENKKIAKPSKFITIDLDKLTQFQKYTLEQVGVI